MTFPGTRETWKICKGYVQPPLCFLIDSPTKYITFVLKQALAVSKKH